LATVRSFSEFVALSTFASNFFYWLRRTEDMLEKKLVFFVQLNCGMIRLSQSYYYSSYIGCPNLLTVWKLDIFYRFLQINMFLAPSIHC